MANRDANPECSVEVMIEDRWGRRPGRDPWRTFCSKQPPAGVRAFGSCCLQPGHEGSHICFTVTGQIRSRWTDAGTIQYDGGIW